MTKVAAGPGRLESWKEIARFLQRSVRTVQRWEHYEGLPVRRLRHRGGDSVYADVNELEQWRARRSAAPPPDAAASAPPRRPGRTRRDASYHHPRPAPPSSVAVLPFGRVGRAGGVEYLGAGFAEELIRLLARSPTLRVAARTSSFALAGGPLDVREIGRRLGVSYVVEGDVRQAGERVRVTAHLEDAADGYHLWVEDHEGEATELPIIQQRIASRVLASLDGAGAVAAEPRSTRRPTPAAAYECYLRGRHRWHERTPRALREAIECFERALRIDPDFALAHVGIAEAWETLGALEEMAPSSCRPLAKVAALRALEIDPDLGQAWAALGSELAGYEWDWVGSERAFRRAIAASPGYATAHQWYGTLLAAQARCAEAEVEVAQARLLDPLSPTTHVTHALVAHLARDHESARARLESTSALFPGFWLSDLYLARVLAASGELDRAVAACRSARAAAGKEDTLPLAHLGHLLGRVGEAGEARRIQRGLERRSRRRYVSPYLEALVAVGLGQRREALDRLEAAATARADGLLYLRVEPMLDPLRSEPRFDSLRRRMGL